MVERRTLPRHDHTPGSKVFQELHASPTKSRCRCINRIVPEPFRGSEIVSRWGRSVRSQSVCPCRKDPKGRERGGSQPPLFNALAAPSGRLRRREPTPDPKASGSNPDGRSTSRAPSRQSDADAAGIDGADRLLADAVSLEFHFESITDSKPIDPNRERNPGPTSESCPSRGQRASCRVSVSA